jgi:CrcB protein
MRGIFFVGAGSFVGGVLRYLLSTWIHGLLDNPWFPYGTLVVNVSGCFVIGFLSGLADERSVFTSEARLFIFIGILGGYTTFSSFALETYALARNTESVAAAANLALEVILGLMAVWAGNVLARLASIS